MIKEVDADTWKIVSQGKIGKQMCEGEYESLKAIFAISPSFVPQPYAWGQIDEVESETYFMLAAFRDVGGQVCTIQRFELCWKLIMKARRSGQVGCETG
jgi:hypothetical protein